LLKRIPFTIININHSPRILKAPNKHLIHLQDWLIFHNQDYSWILISLLHLHLLQCGNHKKEQMNYSSLSISTCRLRDSAMTLVFWDMFEILFILSHNDFLSNAASFWSKYQLLDYNRKIFILLLRTWNEVCATECIISSLWYCCYCCIMSVILHLWLLQMSRRSKSYEQNTKFNKITFFSKPFEA